MIVGGPFDDASAAESAGGKLPKIAKRVLEIHPMTTMGQVDGTQRFGNAAAGGGRSIS